MVIVANDTLKEKRKNLVVGLDGVKFVVVILLVSKNMIYIYVDNALERLQTL